nr:MAG TPA: hypothetical protein [Caudoviricetes sp.]
MNVDSFTFFWNLRVDEFFKLSRIIKFFFEFTEIFHTRNTPFVCTWVRQYPVGKV